MPAAVLPVLPSLLQARKDASHTDHSISDTHHLQCMSIVSLTIIVVPTTVLPATPQA